jgi:predicted MPP superfamily phosphohydrolase
VFLNNRSLYLKKEGSQIRVSGINIQLKYYKKIWENIHMPDAYPNDLLGLADEENFQVLIAHHPDYFPTYAKWGADLTLSGHVHGGIAILPLIGGIISPSYELLPKYDFGLFKKNNSQMILSKGLGSHTIPIRVFNRPELVMVNLRAL